MVQVLSKDINFIQLELKDILNSFIKSGITKCTLQGLVSTHLCLPFACIQVDIDNNTEQD